MKKIILTLVVSCLAIFGCTSSDDNNESSILKEKLIKEVADKWKDLIDLKVYQAMYNYKVEIND